jgi:hypothetical protein
MRREKLESEKSHFAMRLTPRSPRMQYGLDLARKLIDRMDQEVRRRNGELIVFQPTQVSRHPDATYLLNGKYYRCSDRQYRANVHDMTRGHRLLKIPLTVPGWRYGEENRHLGASANNQAMRDLAATLRSQGLLGGRRVTDTDTALH